MNCNWMGGAGGSNKIAHGYSIRIGTSWSRRVIFSSLFACNKAHLLPLPQRAAATAQCPWQRRAVLSIFIDLWRRLEASSIANCQWESHWDSRNLNEKSHWEFSMSFRTDWFLTENRSVRIQFLTEKSHWENVRIQFLLRNLIEKMYGSNFSLRISLRKWSVLYCTVNSSWQYRHASAGDTKCCTCFLLVLPRSKLELEGTRHCIGITSPRYLDRMIYCVAYIYCDRRLGAGLNILSLNSKGVGYRQLLPLQVTPPHSIIRRINTGCTNRYHTI